MLKDIGVSSAGHRLRIRNAIAKLGTQVKNESADGPLTRLVRHPQSAARSR
jgi:hypothetical protein